ncbi:hypothetical protein BJ742DRAFT_265038 [Cladochytrium replicatum]|nr:hypothetical protein BJ742DRAFT_265038 [Cladochytrium replicatum]
MMFPKLKKTPAGTENLHAHSLLSSCFQNCGLVLSSCVPLGATNSKVIPSSKPQELSRCCPQRRNFRILGSSAATPASCTEFGNDVLLSAKILTIPPALKTGYPILIVVALPESLVAIRAKRILVAFPPTPQNLLPFNLSEYVRKTLFKVKPAGNYDAQQNNTGLPPGVGFVNARTNTS